jgi:hypothetical protein
MHLCKIGRRVHLRLIEIDPTRASMHLTSAEGHISADRIQCAIWGCWNHCAKVSLINNPIQSKMAQKSSWKDLAQKKRNAILDSIPAKWRVEQSKLPSNEEQRDVTGYIQQFLSKREVEITETDVVGIARETSTGNWTATEVTEAFCHRASLAHQLVSVNCLRSTSFMSPILCSCKRICRCEACRPTGTHSSLAGAFESSDHILTMWVEDELPPRNIFRRSYF